MPSDKIGVYVHIPFCRSRCPYCHFNTYVRRTIPIADYQAAVRAELDHQVEALGLAGKALESIYFGGGTPSLIPPGDIRETIQSIRGAFPGRTNPEVTLEVFPDEDGLARLEHFRSAGVTRVSFGVQAMERGERERLWRSRSADPDRILKAAQRAAFDHISFDFIYGRPGQGEREWSEELAAIVDLGLPHVSIYALTPEDETPLMGLLANGRVTLPDDDGVAAMAEKAWEVLRGAGYLQYEISNFARDGYPCRHNLLYWTPGGEYLGLGAGAHSRIGNHRWENLLRPEEYIESAAGRGTAIHEDIRLQATDEMCEFFYLGLRRREGVSMDAFTSDFGREATEAFPLFFTDGLANGLMQQVGRSLRLTNRGMLLSDALFRRLF